MPFDSFIWKKLEGRGWKEGNPLRLPFSLEAGSKKKGARKRQNQSKSVAAWSPTRLRRRCRCFPFSFPLAWKKGRSPSAASCLIHCLLLLLLIILGRAICLCCCLMKAAQQSLLPSSPSFFFVDPREVIRQALRRNYSNGQKHTNGIFSHDAHLLCIVKCPMIPFPPSQILHRRISFSCCLGPSLSVFPSPLLSPKSENSFPPGMQNVGEEEREKESIIRFPKARNFNLISIQFKNGNDSSIRPERK